MNSSLVRTVLISCCVLPLLTVQALHAQGARLGVQGILKKSNGSALDDGLYSITFKLYDTSQGGVALWSETQNDVDVTGGIYSVLLGSVTGLNLPFDTDYFLGIKIGSTPEMAPRVQLFTTPYALSLKGNNNIFPSAGTVGGGTVSPTGSYMVHLFGSPDAPKEKIEGTTGALLTFKKGTAQSIMGYGSVDNNFFLDAGSNNILFQYSASTKLEVNTTGIKVTGSGAFSNGLTVTGGTSTLNNIKFNSSSIDNVNNTQFKFNNATKLEITTEGAVVSGYVKVSGTKAYNSSFGYFANDGNLSCVNKGTSSGNTDYSVHASGRIRAEEYNAYSDQRIKKDIHTADNLADQEILRRLRVCDYGYVDQLSNGKARKKGFIAQEVKAVFPEAVHESTDFIPMVFERAQKYSLNGRNISVSLPVEHGLAKGDLVRLMYPKGQQDLFVSSVTDSKTVVFSGWEGERPAWIFVYGKQVDDFLQVDYDRIHTLNVSATKALIRQMDTGASDVERLKQESDAVKSRMDRLESRMRLLEASLSN